MNAIRKGGLRPKNYLYYGVEKCLICFLEENNKYEGKKKQ